MATINRLRMILAAGAVLWLGLGATPLMAADDWQRVEHPTLDMLFTSTAADVAGYDTVYLEPVSVWYPSEHAGAANRTDTLRDWAASELGNAFAAQGLDVAEAPAPDALIVRVQFIDFTQTPVSDEALAWKRRFRFDVEPGRVTMVAELIDANTGSAVVRMADMQDESSELSDDLQSALTGWSTIVAGAVVSPMTDVQLASR